MAKKIPLLVVERKLGRERAAGQMHYELNKIELDPRQKPKEFLDTAIHETLHSLHPHWVEGMVVSNAKTLTEVLWKLGYRRIHQ